MTRPASDVLSLTLPAKGRSRTRWKRPRRPTLWEAWFLVWTVFSICWAVIDLLAGHLIGGGYFAVCAGCWWRGYQRARRGHPFALSWLSVGWISGLGLLLIVTGVPGG